MKNIVFLCSGNGGNLRFVQSVIELELLPGAQVVAAVADRDCGALEYARAQGLQAWSADFSQAGQAGLVDVIAALEPDIIVTNIHKILFPVFVRAFEGRLINLHYALLPAFPGVIGTKPVEQAIAYGAKWTGATVHHVSEELDLGRPIVQAAVPLREGDSVATVMDAVFRAGCLALYAAIERRTSGRSQEDAVTLNIQGRCVAIHPTCPLGEPFGDEAFWDRLKG